MHNSKDVDGFHRFIHGGASSGVLISDFIRTGTRPLISNLSPEAQSIFDSENAGGNSIMSETLSCDILVRAFGASDIRGELDILYPYAGYYPADLMARFDGVNICISVTRGMNYRDPSLYNKATALDLIERKIFMLRSARDAVMLERDCFRKSILHIWCQERKIADIIVSAFDECDHEDTFLLCTVASRTPQLFLNLYRHELYM